MKYTREIAKRVMRDWNKYINGFGTLSSSDMAFLDSKFPKKLPEMGLLVHNYGSLIFRTGEKGGYGFNSIYKNSFVSCEGWSFKSHPEQWKPATPEDFERFKTLVLDELRSRGVVEGTEFKSLVTDKTNFFTGTKMSLFSTGISIGGMCVYRKGKWIEPIKKDVLKDVVSALESTLKEGYIIESKDGVVTIKSI